MKQTRAVELGAGMFVLLGFAAIFFLTTQTTDVEAFGNNDGYELVARFDNVGSLKVRSPVSIAGVAIGRVTAIDFDPNTLEAVVTMRVDARYDQIPDDSDASIRTQGLLGGQYIGLEPGGSETYFKNQDQIEFTQSAIILESLVSKYLFDKAEEK